jgi:molybdopterin molybdotransferase
MSEFLSLLPPNDALQILLDHLPERVSEEWVDTLKALGRVTTQPVCAPHALPSFTRSAMDGYAVRAVDTYGASDGLPAYLELVGEVPMGVTPSFSMVVGQAALIHTGGMLPEQADAVVMLEYTQRVSSREIEILHPVAVGENVLMIGEDVKPGEEVIPRGAHLRPAEVGGLAALGIMRIKVACKPRVGILSSGDEVVPAEVDIQPGQVRDANSYSLSALVEQAGGVAVRYGILPDKIEALRPIASRALDECDVVIFTAGSSASTRDLTAQIISELGAPGVLVHGVNVKPGKPTILAVCKEKAVIGLPGNPVSALVIAELILKPVIERLLGMQKPVPRAGVLARLTVNLASQAGREDWVPVRLVQSPEGYQAEPVFGKSNLIFTLARADGYVRIPLDSTGLDGGETVYVYLSS